jgi:hypothetical protein
MRLQGLQLPKHVTEIVRKIRHFAVDLLQAVPRL